MNLMKKTFPPFAFIAGMAMLCAPISGFAQGMDDVVRAFEKNGEYVKPLSTLAAIHVECRLVSKCFC